MNIKTYLALRYITRNKKRTLLLILGISIVLMMSIAITIVKSNALNQQVINAQINYGNWHLAYKVKDKNFISIIEKHKYVESVSLVYRLRTIPIDKDIYSLDLTLIQHDKMNIICEKLVQGVLPEQKNEIAIEEWFLKKNKIISLPASIFTGGIEYRITGAFKTKTNNISNKTVKAFSIVEANQALLKPELLSQIPLTNSYLYSLNGVTENTKENTTFIFIRLKSNVRIDNAVSEFERYNQISEFDQKDTVVKRQYRSTTPLYNISLIAAEGLNGAEIYTDKNTYFNINQLSRIINLMLICVLFIMVYISMNIVVNNNIRTLGLLSAIGLEPERIRDVVILQTLFIAIIAIPLGIISGIAGSYLFLSLTVMQLNSTVMIPILDIIVNIVACISSIVFAAIYPAIRVSRLSPVNAINTQINVSRQNELKPSKIFNLGIIKGKKTFSIIYGFKNAIKNTKRFFGFVAVITLLIAIFIDISMQIEVKWKTGNWRQSYNANYVIVVPYISPQLIVNENVKPVDEDFKQEIDKIKGIKNIYYHYSIIDNISYKQAVQGKFYNYFFYLNDRIITRQASKLFELSCPVKREGYPQNVSFIYAGLSGYGEKELEFAKKYLIEGRIDIKKMSLEPIILLPKYITWLENINMPYTTLKVGDKVKLMENDENNLTGFNIINEYTFTIGGFVDSLPFRQISGASNGFVAIMHPNQLKKLATKGIDIMEIYVDVNEEVNSGVFSELKKLCINYGYTINNNKDSFEFREKEKELTQYQFALYSIFGVLGLVIFLAIFNMFVSGILMRKTEFAILYAIGMSKGQIAISVISESVLFGLTGSILGGFSGIALIYAGGDFRSEILTKIELIPWIHLLISIILVLTACLLSSIASLIPIWKSCSVYDIKQE